MIEGYINVAQAESDEELKGRQWPERLLFKG